MPKKRVSVTLRKPASPPAPEGASAPESAAAASVENVVARAADAVDTSAVESAVIRAAEVPLEPTTVEAFVNGAAAALEKAATENSAQQLETVLRRGPDGYKELTIYLPEKLAQELSIHCLERNLDMNHLIATAVEQLLRLANVAPEAASASESQRRSRRSRLRSLAAWVRSMIAARRPSWLLGVAHTS
jgi:hypothetical protein